MKHSDAIYSELKEINSFLAEVEKTNVFSVPENYFSGLTTQILQVITGNPLYILPTSETHFFSVPEGYFDNLSTHILNKIKRIEADAGETEQEQLSPLLHSLRNRNIFTVPTGYFEKVPELVLRAVHPVPAKVISITRKNSVWNYAAAAVLAGVMAVSALWISNNSSQEISPVVTASVPAAVKEATQYKNEQQINEGIANLADDDIIKYLENTGNSIDDDLLATSIKGKDLPAEQDYLIDDKTLNTYLDNVDSKVN